MENTILILQGILALLFFMAGVSKMVQKRTKLIKKMPWISAFKIPTIRFIGTVELIGAICVFIPQLFGTYLKVPPYAAIFLALVMVFAAIFHIGRREFKDFVLNIVLLVLLIIVFAFRF